MNVHAASGENEAAYRRYLDFGSLVNGGRIRPNWLPDGSGFWYAEGGPDDRKVVRVDPAANTLTPMFDVVRLRNALYDILGHEPAGRGIPFEHFHFTAARTVAFTVEKSDYELDLDDYGLSRRLPPSTYSTALVRSEAERVVAGTFLREKFWGLGKLPSSQPRSPDGRWIASVEDENLVLRAAVDGQTVQVTRDGTAEAFWDVEGDLWNPWSPDGQHLAVVKQHTDGMARVPSIEWLKPLEQAHDVIVIPAGGVLYRSELYLVDVYLHQRVHVDLGDTTDKYLRILSWLPDSAELFVALYDRVFSRVEVVACNVITGVARPVLVEQSDTFLSNHHRAIWGTDTGFTVLPDGTGFLWESERSGWNHLYLYDLQGQLVCPLTWGEWRVKDVVGVDQIADWIYFSGHGDESRPYDTHLYRVHSDGSGLAQLTEGKGQHAIHLAPSSGYFTDTSSAVDMPPVTVLRRADGTYLRTIGEANIDRLKNVGWVAPQEHIVKAADDVTDLWATVYFPYNFDPRRSYPVLEHIYAGPQSVWRPRDFGDHTEFSGLHRHLNFRRALANLGFVVVTLDARGTPGRSRAFRDVVFRNWGQCEIADHAGALRQLAARLGCLDLSRVGVWGASWGGHFAFRAMTQAPDLYRAGICEVPGFDPRRLMLSEVYLGLPRENKAAYDAADALALAPCLEGELLLICGTNDPGTQADVFKMSEMLIRRGKQHRMMIYPNSGHGALGKTAEYDFELKKRFFCDILLAGQ